LPGNHDDLTNMTEVLPSDCISLETSFEVGHWRILLLNSVIVGKTQGKLSPETLLWLEQELEQNGQHPVLIALHHPPFPINLGWKDAILQEPEDLFAVINLYPQVKLVIAGHVHQAHYHEDEGVHYLTAPSTCIQFDEPPPDAPDNWESPQPGFRLVELRDDGSFGTSIERIGEISVTD
jgi:Icc protein